MNEDGTNRSSQMVLDTPYLVLILFEFLDARALANSEQCCRAFKVLIPVVARQRERLLQGRWTSTHRLPSDSASTTRQALPKFLLLIEVKSYGAWSEESSKFKGWSESLYLQEEAGKTESCILASVPTLDS